MDILVASEQRRRFFDTLFSGSEGYLCIATVDPKVSKTVGFSQQFFRWPEEHNRIEKFIFSKEQTHNVYFCVNLLDKPQRLKRYCLPTNLVWSDLDEVNPLAIETIPPSIVLQTSENRFQAVWRLNEVVEPSVAESYSKRIAYKIGADASGWDLTQLLRVPYTFNFKHNPPYHITMKMASESQALVNFFEALPATESEPSKLDRPVPSEADYDYEAILEKYRARLSDVFAPLHTREPDENEDWSIILWRLINVCYDAEMGAEEVFIICNEAACNKYRRDNRPSSDLWRDVLKAETRRQQARITPQAEEPIVMPQLVEESQITETFLDKYREWAIEVTDAAPEFHDLCGSILLSSVVSASVRLKTSYGPVIPNLWGILLGDSTLARKTTSMRMVTNILNEINPELILASDGSPEGLLTGLQTRPNKVSIFYRDEVHGFLSQINNREYLKAMPEFMAELYDSPPVLTRWLRKERIRVDSPIFIFFGAGVTSRVHSEIKEAHVLSGFLPRFLVVRGDTNLDDMRSTGPPIEGSDEKQSAIVGLMADLYENYSSEVLTIIGGQKVMMPPLISAKLSQEAWFKFADYEKVLLETGKTSFVSDLTGPTFERLSKSLMKLALVLGASRQFPDKDGCIAIEIQDLNNAAWYIQKWGQFSIELLLGASGSDLIKNIKKVFAKINDRPGITKGQLYQYCNLSKRETEEVLEVLIEDGKIIPEKHGRGWRYYPR